MSECKAITNAGKPCRSRASSDGFCGGHSPVAKRKITGRRPRPLPAPIEDLGRRYLAGETVGEIAQSIGVKEEFLWYRLRNAGVQMRRTGARFGHSAQRQHDVSTEDLVARWDEGRSWQEISNEFGLSRSAVYVRMWEAIGRPEERRLRKLYVEEELPLVVVREKLGIGTNTLLRRIASLGIEVREASGRKKERVAKAAALWPMKRAALARRTARTGDPQVDRLSARQRDLLDILRAAPEPLSTGRISRIVELLPRKYRGVGSPAIHNCLRTLERRGLIEPIESVRTKFQRGRKVILWIPASETKATSREDAERLRELQVLIEEQETEANRGGWAENTGAVSLDAPLTEDGFTILDTLGDEDEALADLIEEAV